VTADLGSVATSVYDRVVVTVTGLFLVAVVVFSVRYIVRVFRRAV
jgi:hypothetical protein